MPCPPRCVLLAISFVLLLANMGHAQPLRLRDERPSHVKEMAFSPDGTKLAIVYYRPAFNRPGTDWESWLVVRDLKTGKRSEFSEVMGPLRFSTDGKKLHGRTFKRERMQAVPEDVVWTLEGEGASTKPKAVERKIPEKANEAVGIDKVNMVYHPVPLERLRVHSPDRRMFAVTTGRSVVHVKETGSGRLLQVLYPYGESTKQFRVAAVQFPSVLGQPEVNRRELRMQVRLAARNGAEIVVLPETCITGYMSQDIKRTWQVGGRKLSDGLTGVDPKDAAETVPGESTRHFAKLADEYDVYVTVPLLEVDRKTGRYYNTSVLVGPEGNILLHYRKRNPWWWAERGWASAGDRGNPVVDTPFGRLGLLICYDIHDQSRIMGRLKIDHLLYSIAWVDDEDSDWFDKRLPAIAKREGFNIIGGNWSVPRDAKPEWFGYGMSRIITADGNIAAKAEDDHAAQVVVTELPLPVGE